jgi:hypothetical protein
VSAAEPTPTNDDQTELPEPRETRPPGTRPSDLTPAEARALTDEIKASAATLLEQIHRAYTGRAHVALNYANWPAYVQAEFGQRRSQAYALAELAATHHQIQEDFRTSENSDWSRTLRPSHIAVLKGLPLQHREQVLREAFRRHQNGERITARVLMEIRDSQERERRAADSFYSERDSLNHLVSWATSFRAIALDGKTLDRIVWLERQKIGGLPGSLLERWETNAEWHARQDKALEALRELPETILAVAAASQRFIARTRVPPDVAGAAVEVADTSEPDDEPVKATSHE